MTDKEVIIDNTDVSKCDALTLHLNEYLCSAKCDSYCSWNSNCDYKQYKRQTENIKILKQRLIDITQTAKQYVKNSEYYIQKLEKENKNLKKTFKKFKAVTSSGDCFKSCPYIKEAKQ